MRSKHIWAALMILILSALTTQSARAAVTITVNTTADAVSAADNQCSLREAITAANTDTASGNTITNPKECVAGSGLADTITFAIGSGPQTIDLTTPTPLPALSEMMTIDGTTQNGYSGTPLITIDGGAFDTFHVTASDVTIKGLILVNAARAILLDVGTSRARIQGNYIGTNGTGAAANDYGIEINGSNDNYIGGNGAGEGNVISGNRQSGIHIGSATPASGNNTIVGNKIGTDAAGTAAVPNSWYGVYMYGAGPNRLVSNLISGNGYYGVYVEDSFARIALQGNRIGTNAAGTAALANPIGVYIDGTPQVFVGSGNLISGNTQAGVQIVSGSAGTTVYGNTIGADATGQTALANGTGIILDGASDVSIGSASWTGGNLISGNSSYGIQVTTNNGPSDHLTISRNRIGTNLDGTGKIGNGSSGIDLRGDSHTVGGVHPLAGNLISGNGGAGIAGHDVTNLTVMGNRIGTNAAGGGSLPNARGLAFEATALAMVEINDNLIANSTSSGVYLPLAYPSVNAANNCIVGNAMGVERGAAPAVDFTNNWWGAANGPSVVGPGSGDKVSANVTFTPWLTSAPSACRSLLTSSAWTHTFAGVVPGQSSAPYTITLNGGGGIPLKINGAITSDSAEFVVSNTCDNQEIAASIPCSFTATFRPSAQGIRTGTLTIPDTAEGGPHTITLSGLGATGNPPPALKSPKNGAPAYKPPKLSWKKVRTATGYTVEVDNNDDFSSPEQVGSTTRKTSLPTTRLPFGVYFWHVASIDATGQGVYSAPFSYEVTINKSPRKNATLKTGVVTVKWQAIRGSTYTLRINDENAHSVYFLSPSLLSKPSYKFDKTAPIPSGSYSWQVSTDGGSIFTPLWYFTVR